MIKKSFKLLELFDVKCTQFTIIENPFGILIEVWGMQKFFINIGFHSFNKKWMIHFLFKE